MKTENWNNYPIRFVEVDGEWWAVAKDVADALGYAETRNMTKIIQKKYLMSSILDDTNAKSTLISEFGIYKAVFRSHKPEAEQFQEWVFNIIKDLRQATGLEGFEVFRLMDKDHQRQAMKRLDMALEHPRQSDYIKANIIANKAVATKYGLAKMIKKCEMTPAMLTDRQQLLDETVDLMAMRRKYGLEFPISKTIYKFVAKR